MFAVKCQIGRVDALDRYQSSGDRTDGWNSLGEMEASTSGHRYCIGRLEEGRTVPKIETV